MENRIQRSDAGRLSRRSTTPYKTTKSKTNNHRTFYKPDNEIYIQGTCEIVHVFYNKITLTKQSFK